MWKLTTSVNYPYAYLEQAFSDEEIKDILLIPENWNIATTFSGVDSEIRDSKVHWIDAMKETNYWLYRKITDIVLHLNDQFYQYDLLEFESFQLTQYGLNQHYKSHVDYGYSGPGTNRKLSVILQLNDEDDYEGGDVLIYDNRVEYPTTLPKTKGMLIVFPSFMLHQVMPVTKGTRHSLVAWTLGPKFK
jgi:PKHD-type hydroxylase